MARQRIASRAEPKRDSTAELLTKFRAGDPSAEAEIVGRQLPSLRRWARGRLPRQARAGQDTEDLVQDTLAHALTRLAVFDSSSPGALQAYLRESVRNRVRDEVRRLVRRPPAEPLHEARDRGPTPLELAVAAETDALYQKALSALRPLDRAIVRARIDREWGYGKIARAFGKPSPDAARMAVTRAMRRLLHEMQAGPIAP